MKKEDLEKQIEENQAKLALIASAEGKDKKALEKLIADKEAEWKADKEEYDSLKEQYDTLKSKTNKSWNELQFLKDKLRAL